MPAFEFTETTSAPADRVLAALIDFGPGRSERFPNSAEKHLQVRRTGETTAEVTEGSSGVWETLRYDWTDPHDVRLRTIDSNAWGGASGHRWQLTPVAGGGTRVHVTVIREPKNLRGRMTAGLLRVIGKRLIGGQLRALLMGLERSE